MCSSLPKLIAVRYLSNIEVPVPYMRWNETSAIVVMGNRHTEADAHLTLQIPLERLQGVPHAHYRVTDLWKGGRINRRDIIAHAGELSIATAGWNRHF